MNNKRLIRKAFSMCLSVALLIAPSASAFAGSEKLVGEISVGGKVIEGQNSFVKINGENVQSGRSVFTGSVVSTPGNASAVINFGKVGKIDLAPNTIIQLSFDDNGIKGDLSAGRITVLSSLNGVTINTPDGKTTVIKENESANASNSQAQNSDDEDNGGSLLIYAAIIGGAVAGIIYAATADNKIALGGGATVTSTIR